MSHCLLSMSVHAQCYPAKCQDHHEGSRVGGNLQIEIYGTVDHQRDDTHQRRECHSAHQRCWRAFKTDHLYAMNFDQAFC